MRKLVIGVAGASGAVYAHKLLDSLSKMQDQWQEVGVVMSSNAKVNWELELGEFSIDQDLFKLYEKHDFNAPFASGSAQYDTMIVIPCSMGFIGRVASGMSNDLMTRAADVVLKERRKLILVPRETPLSLIHLRNMTTITEAGGIICPAIPSFYGKTASVDDLIMTVVNRILDLAGFEQNIDRWGK